MSDTSGFQLSTLSALGVIDAILESDISVCMSALRG